MRAWWYRRVVTAWINSYAYLMWWRPVRDWFLRIWFCHHNARVIADFEYRMSCVLDHCTRGMSKPYYTVEAMRAAIDEHIQDLCNDAVNEYIQEHEDALKAAEED